MTLNIVPDEIKGRVKAIVSEQLPEFVASDHTTFVAFLEAYYEWVEQNAGAIERTRNISLYADIDKTVDEFVRYFKQNYLIDIPDNIVADKRSFLKNVKDFYQSKGTDKSLILLFRMLFNEEVEVYYPKRDMLRVSDGQFTSDTIMNIKQVTGPVTEAVGKQVVQANQPLQPDINRATALIENFIAFAVGDDFIYELILTDQSVTGTFVAGQTISIIGDTGTITGVVDEIITGVNIPVAGTYYNTSDNLVTKNLTPSIQLEDASGHILSEVSDTMVTEDIGDSAAFDITSIGRGAVQNFTIEKRGRDYELNDPIVFSDSNLGSNSNAIVNRIEGRLIAENSGDGILLESGANILAGDIREIAKEDGDLLTLEDGGSIIPETADYVGAVHSILTVNAGGNYTELPVVEVSTVSGGSGAEIYALSDDIGRITNVQRTNLGSGYSQPPLVTAQNNIIYKNATDNFVLGETINTQSYRILREDESNILLETGDILASEDVTVETGTITAIDTTRNLLKVRVNSTDDSFGTVHMRTRIEGQISGAVASIAQCNPATIRPLTGTVSTSEGVLFGADGRISESSKKIQDSFYYQDFSYVVKVGNSINIWRDAVKRILHPVGLALFGEVSIATTARARVYGGSDFRLNGAEPRFKSIKLLNELLIDCTMTPQMQALELELFFEVAKATLFPTRILNEDGSYLIMEDSFTPNSSQGKDYLRGEEYVVGSEPGAVYPKLIFPRYQTPLANIDATMLMLKQVILYLREGSAAFDNSANIPTAPNNVTATGNQHNKTDETPDIMLILQTFEAYMNDATSNVTSVKHELQIYKQLAMIARKVQNVVTLLLPTITSSEDLKVVATSKLHLIASLGLEDAHLHESFGSAKLGSTGYSIDRFKFLFPPYADTRTVTKEDGDEILLETGDEIIPELRGFRNIDRGGRIYRADYDSSVLTANYTGTNTSNDTYWDTHSNVQIKHLNDLVTVSDLVNFPGRKTSFAFDSEIFLRDS